jgi:hypothetical protein
MIPISKEKYDMMLKKLDSMYAREEEIKKVMSSLKLEFEQIQDDKELLQTMIMHQANKDFRKKNF